MKKNSGQQQSATEMAERQAQEAMADKASVNTGDGSLFPPNASAGECFARVFVPPTYRTNSGKVLKKSASERIEVISAWYEWVEEKILVKEALSSTAETRFSDSIVLRKLLCWVDR